MLLLAALNTDMHNRLDEYISIKYEPEVVLQETMQNRLQHVLYANMLT